MSKFTIDSRYNHIGVDFTYWDELPEIEAWCRDPDNGDFYVMLTGITYKAEKDLSAFLLKWD